MWEKLSTEEKRKVVREFLNTRPPIWGSFTKFARKLETTTLKLETFAQKELEPEWLAWKAAKQASRNSRLSLYRTLVQPTSMELGAIINGLPETDPKSIVEAMLNHVIECHEKISELAIENRRLRKDAEVSRSAEKFTREEADEIKKRLAEINQREGASV